MGIICYCQKYQKPRQQIHEYLLCIIRLVYAFSVAIRTWLLTLFTIGAYSIYLGGSTGDSHGYIDTTTVGPGCTNYLNTYHSIFFYKNVASP